MHFDCAGSHKVCDAGLSGLFASGSSFVAGLVYFVDLDTKAGETRKSHQFVRVGSLSCVAVPILVLARATFSALSDRSPCGALRILISVGKPSRHFVRVGISSRCCAVRILPWLAQPSRHFVRVGSLSLGRGANLISVAQPSRQSGLVGSLSLWLLARATLSALCAFRIARSHEFFGMLYDSIARVSWCSLGGPCYMEILTKFLLQRSF